MISSKQTAKHYLWGNNCHGWPLVDQAELSVKQERMPSGTSEVRHYHRRARQFFYVLHGKLELEIEGELFELSSQQGIEAAPGASHKAINNSSYDVEFLVISTPSTKDDRVEPVL